MFIEMRAKMICEFIVFFVSHCPRACNSVAHMLAAAIGLYIVLNS
jgi:hypothetical protein